MFILPRFTSRLSNPHSCLCKKLKCYTHGMSEINKTITAFPGVRVGHSTDSQELTGCTAIVFDTPLTVGYHCREGGAPGTFNTDILQPGMADFGTNALFISGGSLPGGYETGHNITQAMLDDDVPYPSVSGAVIFDLGVQEKGSYFDPQHGAEAYQQASDEPVSGGNVGAGTGASIGKFCFIDGQNAGMKAGVGNALVQDGNVMVGALTVLNALGNVVHGDTVLAGNRDGQGGFVRKLSTSAGDEDPAGRNTTVTVLVTNYALGARQNLAVVARQGVLGHADAIRPLTGIDGDVVFVASTGEVAEMRDPHGNLVENTPAWPSRTRDIVGDLARRATQKSVYDATQVPTSMYEKGYQGMLPGRSGFRHLP
jgi:L-aminopeptidase/D-esterase-like protein